MRDIAFRGKRTDNGEWVYGALINMDDGEQRIATSCLVDSSDANLPLTVCAYVVDPATVGQFTGLTDRNGKRIYEGDIVMCPENECGVPEYEAVPWDYNCFSCMKVSWSKYYEVVGNIHDNPELIQ